MQSQSASPSSWTDGANLRFGIRAGAVALGMFLLVTGIFGVIGKHYRLSFDVQQHQCLPWTAFLVSLKRPDTLRRGDVVAYFPNGQMRHGFDKWIAAAPTPYGRFGVKMVGAVPGDLLEIRADVSYVNGHETGKLDLVTRLGRSPGGFDRVERISPGHYLLVGTEPRSYDGRYWGVVSHDQIIGKAIPLW